MYLKSLVLKGFKSFADRSVLTLEPGITAIVGPNGSGKSNISDAVLWVLGERSAHNLRGQAMEDIIFSGSAARKAVSVAEVELVLDNSDKTLPVEFDEVVITRRMYRSGESEYLVNNVTCRRMDVLDILHDSGLGTGTHSIISQGSLDSILQSRPEDRRALIEEAAGVLKHKQRKEKSQRKLAAMDHHLERVRDVAAEVERQLGPLERKAKRARSYQEASAKLAELQLAVAVDELRKLQGQWEGLAQRERQLTEDLEGRRGDVQAAEQKVSEYQELMRRESEDAGELARKQRRAANVAERLESSSMLVRERRRAALGYMDDSRQALEGIGARRAQAERDLAEARGQMESTLTEAKAADGRLTELEEERNRASAAHKAVDDQVNDLAVRIRECESQVAGARRALASAKDGLSNGLAHMKLVEARKVELGAELDRARDEHERAAREAREARRMLEDLQERDRKAQEALLGRFEARDAARKAHDGLRDRLNLLEGEVRALRQSLRTTREDDPALTWLLDHAEAFSGGLEPVVSSLKVRGAHEDLVEGLLGEDLAALSARDAGQARDIVRELGKGRLPGDVSVVMGAVGNAALVQAARESSWGEALVDTLTYPEHMARVVEALLGDVVLCESAERAFEAHEADGSGLRFASPDGCAIWPTGKVRVFGRNDAPDEGVLARERRFDEASTAATACKEELDAAGKAVQEAEEAYREAQAESLKLSQQLANHKGTCRAAEADEERSGTRLASVEQELAGIQSQVQAASKTVDDLRPEVERGEEGIRALEDEQADLQRQRDARAEEARPLRSELSRLGEAVAQARLACATLKERSAYAERMALARERDLEAIAAEDAESKRLSRVKEAAAGRAAEVLAVMERIAASLDRRIAVLDEAARMTEQSADSMHADAASAREAARTARALLDEATSLMTQAQVEKSRLEVQVETAVDRVVNTCGTPLDVAEQLPELEDRVQVEDEIFRLERRIKNMGTINPDAAEEYAKLKERYDFLAGQLADVESARRSLNRIVRVIDERMKDDFARTFEQVNRNFGEVFALLFPGGTGSLSLDNPDDIEHSGVEVTAQPRGKRLTKMMLMSGGEKSLTALALLFAVYKTRATPFYILDEVEAALDDTNLRRLGSYIETLRDTTQLIMITHQRRTMEMADVLFGVSMQADGVTKVISQKLERALELAE